MTIPQFIETAIEGGWWPKPHHYAIEFVEGEPKERLTNYGAILLDPEAWKAVGKVEGWAEPELEEVGLLEVWKQKFISMARALAEGKTPEQYLETL